MPFFSIHVSNDNSRVYDVPQVGKKIKMPRSSKRNCAINAQRSVRRKRWTLSPPPHPPLSCWWQASSGGHNPTAPPTSLPISKSQVTVCLKTLRPNILSRTCWISGYHGFKTQSFEELWRKWGWNRTIKRWSTFCTGPGSPYSTAVINWPNKECPLCYLKRHKPGHRRTIKDIVLNLLPLEMDFSRAKLPFRLSVVWKAYIENNLLGL